MREKAFKVFCSCINYLNKEALDKAIAKGLWEEKAHLSAVLGHHCSYSRTYSLSYTLLASLAS